MKTKRNLSGVYFRVLNEDTQEFENISFEDLNDKQQDKMLENRSVEWYKSLIKRLSTTINEIGDQCGIVNF